ncbi:hypothetical protein AB4238_13545 [Shewanella sp. 10N.286.45.A1]|uniref:hypothetical protein n=1 Tax=Shewanella sp. 10N.286.45.A1 TaxID=3229694 RepID=UPI00354DF62E
MEALSNVHHFKHQTRFTPHAFPFDDTVSSARFAQSKDLRYLHELMPLYRSLSCGNNVSEGQVRFELSVYCNKSAYSFSTLVSALNLFECIDDEIGDNLLNALTEDHLLTIHNRLIFDSLFFAKFHAILMRTPEKTGVYFTEIAAYVYDLISGEQQTVRERNAQTKEFAKSNLINATETLKEKQTLELERLRENHSTTLKFYKTSTALLLLAVMVIAIFP